METIIVIEIISFATLDFHCAIPTNDCSTYNTALITVARCAARTLYLALWSLRGNNRSRIWAACMCAIFAYFAYLKISEHMRLSAVVDMVLMISMWFYDGSRNNNTHGDIAHMVVIFYLGLVCNPYFYTNAKFWTPSAMNLYTVAPWGMYAAMQLMQNSDVVERYDSYVILGNCAYVLISYFTSAELNQISTDLACAVIIFCYSLPKDQA